jgi:glycerophosphoryl diester phosphodiesterase
LAKRYEAALDIEIRQLPGFYPKIGSLVIEAIKRSRMEESVIVSSLDHTLLYDMKKENGKIDYTPIMLERLYFPARYTKDYLGMRVYETAYDLLGAELGYPKNEADFEDANKRKVGTFVWGVNRADMYPVLLRLGVAGIITQRPVEREGYLDRLFGKDKER